MNEEEARFLANEMRKINVLTDRIKRHKQRWQDAPPKVSIWPSLAFSEGWRETEGLHPTLRHAYTVKKMFEKAPIIIRDDELIVGCLTEHIKGAYIVAAFNPLFVLNMLKSGKWDRRVSDWVRCEILPEDAELLRKDAEYWASRLAPDEMNKALIEELGEEHLDLMMDRAMVFEGYPMRANPELTAVPDWAIISGPPAAAGYHFFPRKSVLDHGLNYIMELAKAEMERMLREGAKVNPKSPEALEKYYLLKALIIECQAVIDWARRHAKLAREMASKETDPVRKRELEQIAENCEWVPANPPRSFWEAVQAIRFLNLAQWIESIHDRAHTLGLLDQMLYPYYEKDLKEGRITRQQAAELLACLWLKTRECEILEDIEPNARHAQGTNLPNVTICGKNPDGTDQTNEVSFLILEVMRQLKLSEPAVYIRYHRDMPTAFLVYALECARDFGGGNPAFLNWELGTERYLRRGIPIEDASQWVASGCLAYNLECGTHSLGVMNLNLPKIFELTLYNGFDPRTGKQLGPKTGDPTQFTSIEQFYEAFLKQVDYFLDRLRRDYLIRFGIINKNRMQCGLAAAMFYETSIKNGRIPWKGGEKYPVHEQLWVGLRGFTDVADSLAAIKYLVFDTKKLTMSKLLEALKANWEGYEDVRQLCLNAPKYGNDDDYVDEIFRYIWSKVEELALSRPDPFTGLKPFLFIGAAAGHIVHGRVVGSLPNGRKAGTPINDGGTSAMPGMDVNGPTANLNSATKVSLINFVGCAHNMKFNKAVLNTPEKIEKMAALLRTYFARGGWHIQFNIISPEELIEAKKNPEKYRNLIVRVAGYSAYFVDLPAAVQDEIINRTTHGF
ncbi:MAG: pyruvate formate lyase family protein [Candidatus Bathyarchaeia archaeon]